MLRFLIRIVILAFTVLGIAHFLPGLYVSNFADALLFALILAIFNAVITPILLIISFPITVLTLGIFALLINALTFWLASLVSYGVYVTTFWGAFFGGLITSIVSVLINNWTLSSSDTE